MEEKPVGWRSSFAQAPLPEAPIAELLNEDPPPWWKQRNSRTLLPLALLAVLVAGLLLTRPKTNVEAAPEPGGVEVLIPLTPLPRGADVLPELLRLVPVDRKTFTRKEQLRLLQSDEVERLRGRLRAKSDLPPGKPLSWSDVVILFPPRGGTSVQKSKISYGKE